MGKNRSRQEKHGSAGNPSRSNSSLREGKPDKSHLTCSHCKRKGHTKDQCFQLLGYPDWWEGKRVTTAAFGGTGAAATNSSPAEENTKEGRRYQGEHPATNNAQEKEELRENTLGSTNAAAGTRGQWGNPSPLFILYPENKPLVPDFSGKCNAVQYFFAPQVPH